MRVRTVTAWMLGLALSAFAGVISAQRLAWKLPQRGVAVYHREARLRPRGMPGLFGPKNAPFLFESELDRRHLFLQAPPAGLRQLPMHLAFDLRRAARGGKIAREVSISRQGKLRLRGKISSLDGEGRQTIEVTVTRVAAKAARRPVRPGLRAAPIAELRGRIVILRTVDRERGVVTEFSSHFTARIGAAAAGRGRREAEDEGQLELRESWTLESVKPNRYPGFRAAVADAIHAGGEYLRKMLRAADGGALGPFQDTGRRSYDSGLLALCLLTMVKAGVDAKDPVLVDGFAELRRRELVDTYSLSIALMAMEALYAPPDERRLLIEGRITEPLRRKVAKADLELMGQWTARLLRNNDASVRNRAYLLRFNYVSGAMRYDNSNTQYALLGLYSAQLCGVSISPTVWFASAKHWLADLTEEKGATVALRLVGQRQYQRLREGEGTKGKRRTVSRGRRVEAGGWPYVGTRVFGGRGGRRASVPAFLRPLTGSMTTAGLTGVTICQAVLRGMKKGGPLLSDLDEARQAGFAWLLRHFSVRENPGKGGQYFYYLYGLERACELNRIALLGARDWYFEGATILLGLVRRRAGRGRRGGLGRRGAPSLGPFTGAGLADTCFAILFLKQAAPPLPVITGGR